MAADPQKTFDGMSTTDVMAQIKANAAVLFPHRCKIDKHWDPQNAFAVITIQHNATKIQAQLVCWEGDLPIALAESIGEETALRAYKSLLQSLSYAIGKQKLHLFEVIQSPNDCGKGRIALDEYEAAT
ncbi:hypothetical protein Slin15195_G023030 [Septoria linicola]|uniref:Uncharacterized protein n=1 Tax=Septoria linicola TaxID=215465 RepID=A0A9Q9AJF0_9PEZI|nr:hypothetical protein Slin14017_G022130 [Septoria linicola]USW48984.1 hypothetical protein Slin15195_G023030 [Septoria linicola]